MLKDLFLLSFEDLCQIPPKQLNEYSSKDGDSGQREEALILAHALVHLTQSYTKDEHWEKAHSLAQNTFIELSSSSYWIHALLHKIEGDLDNAQYWYNRCGGKNEFGTCYAEEANAIWRELSQI